jgi:SET domain-containing protein
MLYVKTKVKESTIEWVGLFADEFIPKWTIIWKFTPGFDLKYTQAEIEKLPQAAQEYIERYAWLSKKSGKICFSIDNGKYFNHSNTPNTLSNYYENEEEVITKAIKDIQPGEELTDDYSTFEEGFDENNI